jgi:hypothetical protein
MRNASSSKLVHLSLVALGSARNGAGKALRAHDCTASEVSGDRASLKSGIVAIIVVASCDGDQSATDSPKVMASNCDASRVLSPIIDVLGGIV